jgi:hypothetical protein
MDSRLARCFLRIITAAIAGTIALSGVSLAADPAPEEQVPAAEETAAPLAASADPAPEQPAAPAPEPVDPAPTGDPSAPPEGTPSAAPDSGAPGAAPAVEDPPALPEPPPKTIPDETADDAAGEDAQTGLVATTPPAKQIESSQQPEPDGSSRPRSRGGSAQAADQEDFQDNPCRDNRRSAACAQFLYPGTCADPDSRACEEYVATNPCARNPRSDGCEIYLTTACFDRPLGPACFFIRAAIVEANPCRQDRNSQECRDYATEEQCRIRGLRGIECALYLELIKVSPDDAQACFNSAIFPLELGRAPEGSLCELWGAMARRSCEAGAVVCLVDFGGSAESIGRAEEQGGAPRPPGSGGGGASEGGARPLSAPFAGGDGGSELAISDPGSEGDAGASGDSETKSDRRKRKRENLPRSGQDLAKLAFLGLLLAGVGAAVRPRRRRADHPGLNEVSG